MPKFRCRMGCFSDNPGFTCAHGGATEKANEPTLDAPDASSPLTWTGTSRPLAAGDGVERIALAVAEGVGAAIRRVYGPPSVIDIVD